MRSLRITVLSPMFTMLLFISSCDKENENKNCGCDSKNTFTIQDSDEQYGYLYKNIQGTGGNVPYTNYTIMFSEVNCGNCRHYFLVCNDSFLSDFGDIPEYPGVEIKFSGEAKELCSQPISPADYTYNYLTLTKIEFL